MEARGMTQAKREQAMVGLFVLVAAALLVGTFMALGGISGRPVKTYHALFPFAGGIEAGTTVRYSGGPKVGRVEKLEIDPQNPTRIDVIFTVNSDLPVKTDSHVKIMSMTPLGDNHVEILPGSAEARVAPTGTLLPSDAYVDLTSVMADVQDITPQARELIKSLNDRAVELKITVGRVNDLISPQNRSNLSALLAESRGLIQEDRPKLKSTLDRLNDASGQLQPFLDDLRKTSAQASLTLDHLDATIGENRPDLHQAVLDLRRSLATAISLTGRLDQTVDVNSENIDEVVDNLRHVTENLKELTDALKARPYLLIRSSREPEHKPGGAR
jgi:phospholipid/cholesterol/gamma-HCH transport system substrate-binding protein